MLQKQLIISNIVISTENKMHSLNITCSYHSLHFKPFKLARREATSDLRHFYEAVNVTFF